MNIVFVCDSYFYNASANSICARKVAEHLVLSGNKVTVLTFFNGFGQKKKEIINGVSVYRVNPGIFEKLIYRFAKKPKLLKVVLFLSKIRGAFFARKYPLLSFAQPRNLYKQAKKLYKDEPFNICVCCYHKIAGAICGLKLKKKFKNKVKCILYTLDSISGGYVPQILHSKSIPMNSLKRWEKKFFENFDLIFVMESHRKHYESHSEYRKYDQKIIYADIPLLEFKKSNKRKSELNESINIVYTGSLHSEISNPIYFLSILTELGNIDVNFYGTASEEVYSKLLSCNKVKFHGRVSRDEVENIQFNADVLLNFGNPNPNMIPCKIFEYMSANKPIISFTHSEFDSSLPYMKSYPFSLIVDERDDRTLNIQKIKRFLDTIDKINRLDTDWKGRFEKNMPEYFEKLLKKYV